MWTVNGLKGSKDFGPVIGLPGRLRFKVFDSEGFNLQKEYDKLTGLG